MIKRPDGRIVMEYCRGCLRKASEYAIWGMILSIGLFPGLTRGLLLFGLACWALRKILELAVQDKRTWIRSLLPSTPANLALFFFVLAGALSVVFTIDRTLSMRGFLSPFLEWVMAYFLVAEHVDTKEKKKALLKVIVLSAFLMSVNAIVQFWRGRDLITGLTPKRHRIRGSFINSNLLAAYLILFLPPLFALAFFPGRSAGEILSWRAHRLGRLVFAVPAFLASFALVLTYSRGAWVAFLLTLLLMAYFWDHKIFLISLCVFTAAFVIAPAQFRVRLMKVFFDPDMRRLALWQQATQMIKDRPLLGFGINTTFIASVRYASDLTKGHYPHNSYLHMAIETGLFGLFSFLWAVAAIFVSGLRKVRDLPPSSGDVLVGFMAGVFAFMVHSFFDTHFYDYQLGILMWSMLGLIGSAVRRGL